MGQGNQLQRERDIPHSLFLTFGKDGHLFVSTDKRRHVSLKRIVRTEISLDSGLLYGLAFVNDVLRAASHDRNGKILFMKLILRTCNEYEKVVHNRKEASHERKQIEGQ